MLVLGAADRRRWLAQPAGARCRSVPSHLLSDWLEPVTGGASRIARRRRGASTTARSSCSSARRSPWPCWASASRSRAIASPIADKAHAPAEAGVAALLADAYRVDAGLDRTVVQPLGAFSARVLWRGIDQRLDRAFVLGGETLARVAGQAHDALGAGDVGRYAWVIALGVLALLAAFTLR